VGEKRPPVAGRALTGGLGPPVVLAEMLPRGRGDGPCRGKRGRTAARMAA